MSIIDILKKFSYLVLAIFIFSSCGKKEEDVPEGIIKPETLTSIIVDLSLADAGQNVSFSAGNSQRFDIWVFYQAALKKHNVTKKQFFESLDWYADHIKLLSEAYDNALIELNMMREKLSAENESDSKFS